MGKCTRMIADAGLFCVLLLKLYTKPLTITNLTHEFLTLDHFHIYYLMIRTGVRRARSGVTKGGLTSPI